MSVIVQSPAVKKLAHDVVFFDLDSLDDTGRNPARGSFARSVYSGVQELKKIYLNNLRIGFVPSEVKKIFDDKNEEHTKQIVFIPANEFRKMIEKSDFGVKYPDHEPVVERIEDDPVEYSELAVSAVRYYWQKLEQIPDMSPDVFDMFMHAFKPDQVTS